MGQSNRDARREIEGIVDKLRKQGWDIERGSRGYRAMPPKDPTTGRRPSGPVFFHLTPSDPRAAKNLRSLLRRRGADL